MIRIRRILVPTDFSSHSRRALAWATTLARPFAAETVILHVMEPPLAPAVPIGIGGAAIASITDEMRRYLGDQLDQLARTEVPQGVRVRPSLREGRAFLEILEAVREEAADLVVIGTHGRTGLRHVLLGSTAERVVRRSPVPVLTVRDDAAEGPDTRA